MRRFSRRSLIAALAGTAGAAASCSTQNDTTPTGIDATDDMPLGIITGTSDPEAAMKHVADLGFTTCQLTTSDYSTEHAETLKEMMAKYEIRPTTLICMGPGRYVWDFYQGPLTIGLVPRGMRNERIERLKQGIDYCEIAGIPAVHAHFGFIPEDPNNELYIEFIELMKGIASYAAEKEINIYFETGQETPVTLLRSIEDIGADNLGINYDTANLIMYGKANPVDGLHVVGEYVRALHAKDGNYPTNPRELGEEKPIGEGSVDFPAVIRYLKEAGFKGHITIEREISGDKQIEDIKKAKEYLSHLIKTV